VPAALSISYALFVLLILRPRKHLAAPRDYYTEAGNLRPAAARAEALLRRALSLDPRHALALHLHIHVAEAGAPTLSGAGGDKAVWAGRGLGSADALAAAAVQQGHLLHMPSHIYVRCVSSCSGLFEGSMRWGASLGAVPSRIGAGIMNVVCACEHASSIVCLPRS
jgi:hypothetical protein